MDIATDLMINEEIRDREVRLIDENGEQLGVMITRKALELAEEKGLDLVKISPNAKPPVCKLMDYDKHRYEQAKREREEKARASQKRTGDRTQLSLLLATAKLSYASAIAIRDHKTNGEMADGVKQYQEAMHEFKKYERELVVDKSYEE